VDDLELKLICVRLLRYITLKEPLDALEEVNDENFWISLKERQVRPLISGEFEV
jgi:hypothetical protein